MIPIKIREPFRQTQSPLKEEMNDKALKEELYLVEEIRPGVALRKNRLKQQTTLRHDTKVIKREFQVGSIVLRRNMKDSPDGKLVLNWKGF